MTQITTDFTQIQAFVQRLRAAAQGDFQKQLELFLEGLGYEFLRILQEEIVRLEVVDTRLLLHSFNKGDHNNVWELNKGNLTLEVGTNVEYAKFVNDGHWTNPEGVALRFVPGVWNGKKFEYQPGAKTGMVLKQKWVEGYHYWESALNILEEIFPQLLDRKLQEWLEDYFKDFL